jgi:hypothetical protein
VTGAPSAAVNHVRSLPPTLCTVAAESTVAFTEIVVPELPSSEVRTAWPLTVAENAASAASSVAASSTVSAAAASARRCGRRRRTMAGALRTIPAPLAFRPQAGRAAPSRPALRSP